MSDYADTGFLCSLYAPDAHTERAIRWMETTSDSIALSWLNLVEFRNALRLRVFRKEISGIERDASISHLYKDLAEGFFISIELPQASVLLEAERLSSLYSERLGTRSLDILHVSMALVFGAHRFIGFDERQNKLAQAVGLQLAKV